MIKRKIYVTLSELCGNKNDMVLVNDEKIYSYGDIDDDILGLIDYADDEETEYESFELVEENENTFTKQDGTVLEVESFNPFGGMVIAYNVINKD